MTHSFLPPVPEDQRPPLDIEALKLEIIAALKTVYDPEIPVDIYELGLIYRIEIAETGVVEIDMTLTSPGCPVAGEMPGMVKDAVEDVPGITAVDVRIVWDPPWDRAKMSEDAQLQLGMF